MWARLSCNLQTSVSSSSSFSSLVSVFSSTTLVPRLTSVGVTSPGETAAVQIPARSSELKDLDCGVGGTSATRFGTVVTAPLIPRQSEGRGPNPPSATDQSFSSPFSFVFPTSTFDPLRIQEDKEKSKPLETKNKQNAVGWRAGGGGVYKFPKKTQRVTNPTLSLLFFQHRRAVHE